MMRLIILLLLLSTAAVSAPADMRGNLFIAQNNSIEETISEEDDISGINTGEDEAAAEEIIESEKSAALLAAARKLILSEDYKRAEAYLEEAAAFSESEAGIQAARLHVYLMALRGDTGAGERAENLPVQNRPAALWSAIEGWDEYLMNNSSEEVESVLRETTAFLAERFSETSWGGRARIKRAVYLMKEEKYTPALHELVSLLQTGEKQMPYDMAWFYLGRLLEHSDKHRDPYRARKAYRRVLSYNDSPYHGRARERIRYLNRYYLPGE